MIAGLACPAVAAADGSRVLVLRDGPAAPAVDARLRAELATRPGVERVEVAAAPLSEVLLASGCEALERCAAEVARATSSDLLVVRTLESDDRVRLTIVDPARPAEAQTLERSLAPARDANSSSVQPITWGVLTASAVVLAGAGIATLLSSLSGSASANAAQRGDTREAAELLGRGDVEATTAGVLWVLGGAGLAAFGVMLAIDFGADGGPMVALAPTPGGAAGEVRWRF